MRQFVCSGVENVSCRAPVGLHLNSVRLSLAKFPLRLVFSQMVGFHLMWSINYHSVLEQLLQEALEHFVICFTAAPAQSYSV